MDLVEVEGDSSRHGTRWLKAGLQHSEGEAEDQAEGEQEVPTHSPEGWPLKGSCSGPRGDSSTLLSGRGRNDSAGDSSPLFRATAHQARWLEGTGLRGRGASEGPGNCPES